VEEKIITIPAEEVLQVEQPLEAPPAPQPAADPIPDPLPSGMEKKPVPDLSVMKVHSFMGALILLAIPIVSFIVSIRWTFRRGINRNKRNLGIAALLLHLLLLFLIIAGIVIADVHFQFSVPGYLLQLILKK